MSLKLFYIPLSPPARAVMLVIRNLGLDDVEIKNVDLLKGEHLTPEFLKLNPVHQLPVLLDDEFAVTESRAIMAYLVNSRKPGSDLYPIDAKKRALIDSRLYFDATVVFPRNCSIVAPIFFEKDPKVSQHQKDQVSEYMKVLETFLENSPWLAGDNPTLADLSVLANLSQICACYYDLSQHPNLSRWWSNCKKLPGFEENLSNASEVGKLFKTKFPAA